MKEWLGREKISSETEEKIKKTLNSLKKELKSEIEAEETPDTITLKIKNEKGQIVKEMGFLKMEYLLVEDKQEPLEKIIEARVRFPDDDLKKLSGKPRN